jgi:23S rRNA (adenine1618-N6)-methyltransferase
MASSLHPRNCHRKGYDFALLTTHWPPLKGFVQTNPKGQATINFHDPAAVKALNQALLLAHYQLDYWDIPATYLCPAVPGRADYLHHLADLLASTNGRRIPRGVGIRCLDIGTGANCVYPILGSAEYGWSFVGTELDQQAIEAAQKIIDRNPRLVNRVSLRQQTDQEAILEGIVAAGEYFDALLCNPPFYRSAREAHAETQRKKRGLGAKGKTRRNFGGQANELWCHGGEEAFIGKLIQESAHYPRQVYWYTSLVAKQAHLPALQAQLHSLEVAEVRVLSVAHGQKNSRILAWTFLTAKQQQAWRQLRWT